jgi:hypothetical protein
MRLCRCILPIGLLISTSASSTRSDVSSSWRCNTIRWPSRAIRHMWRLSAILVCDRDCTSSRTHQFSSWNLCALADAVCIVLLPFFFTGVIFKNSGELRLSIEYYERALKANPNFAIANSNLAIALTDMGTQVKNESRLDEGIAFYKKALHHHSRSDAVGSNSRAVKPSLCTAMTDICCPCVGDCSVILLPGTISASPMQRNVALTIRRSVTRWLCCSIQSVPRRTTISA